MKPPRISVESRNMKAGVCNEFLTTIRGKAYFKPFHGRIRVSDVSDEISDLRDEIVEVHKAVHANTFSRWVVVFVVFCCFFSPLGIIWRLVSEPFHTKFAYSVWYSTSTDNVIVADHPHDCSFLTPPIGEKWCHYKRDVAVTFVPGVMTGVDATTKKPIWSDDGGKTWKWNDVEPYVVAMPAHNVVWETWTKVDE